MSKLSDAPAIHLESALAAEGQGLAIGRPAVKIGGRVGGEQPRRAAGDRQHVDARAAGQGLVADGQQGAIRRNAVVIVDAIQRCRY